MTKEELLKRAEVFLLDLDGTVYLDDQPIGESVRTLEKLRAAGKRLVFLTNNSSKTEEEYRKKLLGIGVLEGDDLVYTSGMACISLLKREYAGKKVYLLGTQALCREFAQAGILLTERDPDVCVLAYDVELTFEKIRKFDGFLKDGALFLATHPDAVCPTAGHPMPDVGSFLAMFKASSGRSPDRIVGKPYREMGDGIARLTGVEKGRMCMVGDRMHTDIRFANNNSMLSILVLSGETTKETMGQFPDRPDLVLPTINDIFSSGV